MPEPERIIARQLGRIRTQELLAHERHQTGGNRLLFGRECLHRADVEELALDRAARQHCTLRRIELIESRGEQRLDRRRHDDLAVTALTQHRDHFLDEERVSACCVADPGAHAVVERNAVQEMGDQLVRFGHRERLEEHGRSVDLSPAPALAPVEQVGAREAEQENGRSAAPVCDMLHEVEECRLTPVDVLQQNHERLGRGRGLEHLSDSPGRLLDRRRYFTLSKETGRSGSRRALDPEGFERGVRLIAEQLEEQLNDGPVRDALAVREALRPQHPGVTDTREELGRQSSLADTGRAEHREQVAGTL